MLPFMAVKIGSYQCAAGGSGRVETQKYKLSRDGISTKTPTIGAYLPHNAQALQLSYLYFSIGLTRTPRIRCNHWQESDSEVESRP